MRLRSQRRRRRVPASVIHLAGPGHGDAGRALGLPRLDECVPIAGEVRQPQRNLPLALLGGVGIIIFLYLGANAAYHLVIPQVQMMGLKDTTVVAEFRRRLVGPIGSGLASAAVMCSVFGALNGNLLVGRAACTPWAWTDWLAAARRAVHRRYERGPW